ncbi:hypothetical protein FPRO04_14602, partial [Fusarium proliferatum]
TSEIIDEIVVLGLPEDQIEKENQNEEEDEKLEDENDLGPVAPMKQSTPQGRCCPPGKEIVDIEVNEPDEEKVVDPSGDGFVINDCAEPVQSSSQPEFDHGTSTPNSGLADSSRPRRSIQHPSRLASYTTGSSARQSHGSADYTATTLAIRRPPRSQHQMPSSQVPVPKPATSHGNMRPLQQPALDASPTDRMQNLVRPRPQSYTAVHLPQGVTQLQLSNSQSSASTYASNSQSSAATHLQASSQPLASPSTSATSLTPRQKSCNWSSASNPLTSQGAYNQLTSIQQSTPHHLAPSRSNKHPAESSPTASYGNPLQSGKKRQRLSHALPHYQSQEPTAVNRGAVLPSEDEFKESLKNSPNALKPVLHKEKLLADINDEQRKLSEAQSRLFQKKNNYTNDQKRAQDALKDVEKYTADENRTLRGLEEVYQQNPGDAELRTFINKRKQTILEHKEVYVVVKSQLDKAIAGIYKTDNEIALVTRNLKQLDAKRADVLKAKEGC